MRWILVLLLISSCAIFRANDSLIGKSNSDLTSMIPASADGRARINLNNEEYLLSLEYNIDSNTRHLQAALQSTFSGEQIFELQLDNVESVRLTQSEKIWVHFLQKIFQQKHIKSLNATMVVMSAKSVWSQALGFQKLDAIESQLDKGSWCLIQKLKNSQISKLCFSQVLAKSFTKIEHIFQNEQTQEFIKQEWFLK